MPEEMFLKTFVGRDEELNMIFSHINFNLIPSTLDGNKKNILIKSGRGIGKTSIFLAVKYKLKAERAHMLNKIIPVFFNEQEDFNTAEKLILRTIEIICSDTVIFESLAHPGEWKKSYSKIKANIQDCFDILDNNLTKEKKKLVLFIENFDSTVFRILRKKGSKKKGKLSTQEILTKLVRDPKILLVCSGIDTPETQHDYGEETFNVVDLKPVGDFYELILKRARYDNNLFLLANKEKLKNKIKAFEYLTGGNTRLMVHLYECMVEKDINKLELMLNDMINKSTPLFEWIIEKFVDFESREILNALARRGGNATIKEIADDTLSSENSVRTLLNRLRKKQFVQKINEKRDKSDIYIMIPMMFFIWYQKSVLQTKDVILDFFIHFVDLFFDPTELADKKRIEQVYRLKEEDKDLFAPYFSYIKKYIDAGKFPLKSSDEKREEELSETDAENEKMIYELVIARKDDTVLQTQIHKAFSFKAEKKLSNAANSFRIAARGYLILTQVLEKSFLDQAEENIRRAIEIYRSVKIEPLETVRCLLILVEILSDTERKEELKLFAQTIIRIGKKSKSEAFNLHLGYAYKYMGFAETVVEKKLERFNSALGYFEGEISQTIVILINIGLTYKVENKYETALNYFEKALEISKNQNYLERLTYIVFFIIDVYEEVEDYRGGLNRINEILEWLESEKYENIDFKNLYNIKGILLYQDAEFLEAEKYLHKCIKFAEKENDPLAKITSLMVLVILYNDLNKTEKVKRKLEEIENIITQLPELDKEILFHMAQLFIETGYFKKAIIVYEELCQKLPGSKDVNGKAFILLKMAFCYKSMDDFENAEKYLKMAIKLSEQNNLKISLVSSNLSYSLFLGQLERIDEAINILENLDNQELSLEKDLGQMVKVGLFKIYMKKSTDEYNSKNHKSALTYTRKGLKYIDYLSINDFVEGFYFLLVLELIEHYGKQVLSFLKELELYLSEYYDDKDKGGYIKVYKYVVDLVKGKDFDKITKDLIPAQRDILRLIKDRLDKDEVIEAAQQLIENKELDKAAILLEKSVKEKKNDFKKLKKLTEVYEDSSQRKKYFETLKRILNFYPENRETLFKLAIYYRKSGEIKEAEKILLSLLENNPQDADVLSNLAFIEKENKNYKGAVEYTNKSIKYYTDEVSKERAKINLAVLYIFDNSKQSIPALERLLQSIKSNKFNYHDHTVVFYFLNIILFIISQKKDKLKRTLSTLIFLHKDSHSNLVVNMNESDLKYPLKKRLKPHEFEQVDYLDRLLQNKISFSSFIKKFADSIDAKMVKDINSELQDAGEKIFKRISEDEITKIDEIVTLCDSRIHLESLLYHIKEEFSNLNESQQNHMVSILTGIMEELPESYKWMALDFCSHHLINLNQNLQTTLISSFLKRLKEREDSNYFLKETRAFLQTAKNMVDETLKEKIEKELIKIKDEVKK